jgi:hypothetical protein
MQYEGRISFKTDKAITPAQISQMLDLLYLQIQEPADKDGNDEDYTTENCFVYLNEEGK